MWPTDVSPKSRRGILRRAVFSEEQRKELERTFRRQKYISKTDRNKLAAELSLKESQVIHFTSKGANTLSPPKFPDRHNPAGCEISLKLERLAAAVPRNLTPRVQLSTECQAGRQWVPFLESLVGPSQESNPQPASLRADARPLGWPTRPLGVAPSL